jgi:hypothetical protein
LTVVFVSKNTLKLTYEHLRFLKFFWGLYPGPPLKGRGRVLEGEGRRERDMWGENGDKGGEEVIREGRERKKKRNGKEEGEGGTGVWEGRRGTGRRGKDPILTCSIPPAHSKTLATPLKGGRDERGWRVGEGKETQVGKFLDPSVVKTQLRR